jgi:hypothetical protein
MTALQSLFDAMSRAADSQADPRGDFAQGLRYAADMVRHAMDAPQSPELHLRSGCTPYRVIILGRRKRG